MALKAKSLFLYGLEVTELNSSIDFKAAALGPELHATLNLGFYSLTGLMTEISRAMHAADPANDYIVTADRSFVGGTENRVTIETTGAFLSLLFGSGTRAATTVAPLIGFPSTDQTGDTSYEGTSSAGTALVPSEIGYTYLSPDMWRKVFGAVNVSASGKKEAIVFSVQKFWQVQFKYELEAKIITEWKELFDWMIRQKSLEFTPDINFPNTFHEGTLETTPADGKGMAYKFTEQLPDWPFYYDVGLLTFRVNPT